MYRGYFFAENARKIEENEWNIGEFPRNSFLNLLPDDPFSRSFSVVFGRFRSFLRSFLEKIGEYRGNLSVFIPFLSTSLHFHSPNPSFLCSTAYLSVNYSHRVKISRFLFGGSGFSSYLCQRLTDDSSLSGRATVSPMASGRRLFLCLIGKKIFPNWENLFS